MSANHAAVGKVLDEHNIMRNKDLRFVAAYFATTLSQNGRFSTKKSGQFRGSTEDALLHSHINRVTFSRTSTLPMAHSRCLCPVFVAGCPDGRLRSSRHSP